MPNRNSAGDAARQSRRSASQTIGVTEITLKYHRPAAKGRKVFGELESYDKVWRAGANDATTIAFSMDVKVEGQPLKAMAYALFIRERKGDHLQSGIFVRA